MQLFETNNDLTFEMKNRFIRSATHEAMATKDGAPTQKLENLYVKLAKGGVGAIITGLAAIQPNGKSDDTMLMMDRDELIEPYQILISQVKPYNCRMIVQLAHCGAQSTIKDKVAPSVVRTSTNYGSLPWELTDSDIEEIINNFVKAIIRSEKAGFDGVQLHGAHGYLLSAFLVPFRNRRKDRWGGSLENRFRIIREIIVRAKTQLPDYPIFIKLSVYDFRKKGLMLEESITICKWLEEIGCNGVEVSCGVGEDGWATVRIPKNPLDAILHFVPQFSKIKFPLFKGIMKLFINSTVKVHTPIHNYNLEASKEISKHVSIPLMLVGGIRKLDDMKEIVEKGYAHYISMCRPFILVPSLVNKLQEGKQTSSRCIDCGYCLLGIISNPLKCYYGKLK